MVVDAGDGDILYDHSGNQHHGEVWGAQWVSSLPVPPHNGPEWWVQTTGSDVEGNGSIELPFRNIQTALDAVNENDVIYVGAGSFIENLVWPETDGINLIGGTEGTTVIDDLL